jgi:hypothetical protein
MGDRIKVKDLIKWLSGFDEESDVAFLHDGVGRDGCNDSALELHEIIERTISGVRGDGQTLLFINVK